MKPMTIVMPLHTRTEYLTQVAEGLRACSDKEDWNLILVPQANTPNFALEIDYGLPTTTFFEDGCVTTKIRKGFQHAFDLGADSVMYLSDDCVPCYDMLRCARWLSQFDNPWGLWLDTWQQSERYPELILRLTGHIWPKSAFGCCKEWWPLIKSEISEEKALQHTYDQLLAIATQQRVWFVMCPILSRVKDIGRNGHYLSQEKFDSGISWVPAARPFTADYRTGWGPILRK